MEQIDRGLRSPRAGDRLRALGLAAAKRGSRNVRLLDDPAIFPRLVDALDDPDLRVRRAAARALRPWIEDRPELLPAVLPRYSTDSFDGSYSHAGLYDTEDRRVRIPRWAAVQGHAALLASGNTDRYVKFEFFKPSQVPARFRPQPSELAGHLAIHLIHGWSYRRQELLSEQDERGRSRALEEQHDYATRVIGFYESCALTFDVRVHHVVWRAGHRAALERDVALIAPTSRG